MTPTRFLHVREVVLKWNRRQLGQHILLHHQHLEAIGQPLGQRALDAEAAVQPEAEPEGAVGQGEVADCLLVTLGAAVAHGVDQPVAAPLPVCTVMPAPPETLTARDANDPLVSDAVVAAGHRFCSVDHAQRHAARPTGRDAR